MRTHELVIQLLLLFFCFTPSFSLIWANLLYNLLFAQSSQSAPFLFVASKCESQCCLWIAFTVAFYCYVCVKKTIGVPSAWSKVVRGLVNIFLQDFQRNLNTNITMDFASIFLALPRKYFCFRGAWQWQRHLLIMSKLKVWGNEV